MKMITEPPDLPPIAATETFDREDFVERLMGDEHLAQRIIRGFVDDMPRQLALLALAVSNTDSKALRMAAHSIKGAAANVGGCEMRDVARKVEQSATAGDMTAAQEALPELSASFARAKPIMERFCREESGFQPTPEK